MDLYPAVDLLDGRCVRLVQGDYQRQSVYGDPVETAVGLAQGGAPWLHVVDLDAARTGQPTNHRLIETITAAVEVPVQAGGGIRTEARAAALLDAGVTRVVIGTAALEDPRLIPQLAGRHPGRIAVGLDHRRATVAGTASDPEAPGELALRGWTEGSGAGLMQALARFEDAGVAAVVITDIARDGTLQGPDLAGLSAALGATRVDLIASGGVGSVGDLAALAGLDAQGHRLTGAIVGRAIHDGRLTLEEALAACAQSA